MAFGEPTLRVVTVRKYNTFVPLCRPIVHVLASLFSIYTLIYPSIYAPVHHSEEPWGFA